MLAIAGTQRHPRIPDVPTMPEAGYPDVADAAMVRPVRAGWHAGPIVQKLNAEFVKALQSEDVKTRCCRRSRSSFRARPMSWRACVARDMVRLGKVVERSGAKAPD